MARRARSAEVEEMDREWGRRQTQSRQITNPFDKTTTSWPKPHKSKKYKRYQRIWISLLKARPSLNSQAIIPAWPQAKQK
jgi:hypothetical protein